MRENRGITTTVLLYGSYAEKEPRRSRGDNRAVVRQTISICEPAGARGGGLYTLSYGRAGGKRGAVQIKFVVSLAFPNLPASKERSLSRANYVRTDQLLP